MKEQENALLKDLVDALNDLAEKHPQVSVSMFCVMLMSELLRTARAHPNKKELISKLDSLWINLVENSLKEEKAPDGR